VSPDELDRDLEAYDNAGYGYGDAVQLAKIWHAGAGVGFVKAEAGRRLLAGEALPIPPHPDSSDPATPSTGPDDVALSAFFDAGYTADDAARLARLWKLAEPSDAKIAAGKKLEADRRLPFPPAAANLRTARDEAAKQRFWDAGYDSKDAEKLSRLWHVSVSQAKVEGGQKLLAGETLPIRP
jgi:hypothetical protein